MILNNNNNYYYYILPKSVTANTRLSKYICATVVDLLYTVLLPCVYFCYLLCVVLLFV
jgi:hypothetical protein